MASEALQILSYNVRYFGHALRGLASTRASMRGIARVLAALDPTPDVVCLQEIETRSLRAGFARGRNGPDATQLELFMVELETAFAAAGRPMVLEGFYFPAHVNWVGNVPVYTTGLAVLVRMDRLLVAAHNGEAPHRITYHRVERWKDRKQTRICAHLRVLLGNGQPLHVFNTHLSLPSPFVREFWQRRERMGWGPNQLHEACALAGFVRKFAGDEPFVVCGDFNSPPASPVYRFLVDEAGFAGAQECCGQIDCERPRAFPTAGFMRLRMHLDHVFAGNGITWMDVDGTRPFGDGASPFSGLSDHVPLFARFAC
ncbi:MAG TPA: endonuclease/exonuclease/phosphatase family protein, partial [Anaeromyxobacteraceae bacterium]|nr:endonuclease/exonuclease/phosphatase family protein [Anaeromyxobacteraceae bacterium]